jgi:hypothetical protein
MAPSAFGRDLSPSLVPPPSTPELSRESSLPNEPQSELYCPAVVEWESGARADIAYMIDQSHNLKGKMEATIQTVMNAQELYAKAAIVDHERLASAQARCQIVEAEMVLRDAFSTDVRPDIREWRRTKRLPIPRTDHGGTRRTNGDVSILRVRFTGGFLSGPRSIVNSSA